MGVGFVCCSFITRSNRRGDQKTADLHLISFEADALLLESILNHIEAARTGDGKSRMERFCFATFITRVRCHFNEHHAHLIVQRYRAQAQPETSPSIRRASSPPSHNEP